MPIVKRYLPRPFSVTLLTWIVLIMSVSNLIKFIQSILRWNFLSETLPFSPAYLLVSGLIWSIAGLIITWGLLLGLSWTPLVTKLFITLYTLYYWLDRILLNNPISRDTNWMFVLGLTVIFWILVLWIFSNKDVKKYFGVLNE